MKRYITKHIFYILLLNTSILSGVLSVMIVRPGSVIEACITAGAGALAFLVLYVIAINAISNNRGNRHG